MTGWNRPTFVGEAISLPPLSPRSPSLLLWRRGTALAVDEEKGSWAFKERPYGAGCFPCEIPGASSVELAQRPPPTGRGKTSPRSPAPPVLIIRYSIFIIHYSFVHSSSPFPILYLVSRISYLRISYLPCVFRILSPHFPPGPIDKRYKKWYNTLVCNSPKIYRNEVVNHVHSNFRPHHRGLPEDQG